MDDDEGRYNLYSYEKLFGLRPLSDTDRANQACGADSVIERTRRLLYVCVSRAVDELAVIMFVGDVTAAQKGVLASGIIDASMLFTEADLMPVAD